MKKISIAMCIVMVFTMMFTTFTTLATEQSVEDKKAEIAQSSNASEVTLKNLKTKEEKIAYYTEKYGDETKATVAYWISIAQVWSVIPCVLLLLWGALNCFIIGNKKLHAREQGFNTIIASIIGLVAFQVIPFIYAICVAGR